MGFDEQAGTRDSFLRRFGSKLLHRPGILWVETRAWMLNEIHFQISAVGLIAPATDATFPFDDSSRSNFFGLWPRGVVPVWLQMVSSQNSRTAGAFGKRQVIPVVHIYRKNPAAIRTFDLGMDAIRDPRLRGDLTGPKIFGCYGGV